MMEKVLNKLISAVKSRKYEILIFAALCMNFLILLSRDELITSRFYGVLTFDTHFGVYSLTLIGSIIKLIFGEHPTIGNVLVFQWTALILGYILVALFIGGTVRRADEKYRNFLACLAVFVSVIHIGFSDFTELFDLLDVYWLIGVVIALFLAKNDITRFVVPLLAVSSMWVHYGFLMTYMPVIYIMCIYFFVKKSSKVGAVQLVFMLIFTVVGSCWFFFKGRSAGIEYDDLLAYVLNKTGESSKDSVTYLWHHFSDMSDNSYYDMTPFYEVFGYELSPLSSIMGNIYVTFQVITFLKIAVYTVLIAPFVVFFEYIWKASIRATQNKAEKFVFFLCAISPIVNYIGFFTSSDSSRMAAHLIVSQLLILFMFVKDENTAVGEAVDRIKEFFTSHFAILSVFAVFYISMVFDW